jgi:hypothetical protein
VPVGRGQTATHSALDTRTRTRTHTHTHTRTHTHAHTHTHTHTTRTCTHTRTHITIRLRHTYCSYYCLVINMQLTIHAREFVASAPNREHSRVLARPHRGTGWGTKQYVTPGAFRAAALSRTVLRRLGPILKRLTIPGRTLIGAHVSLCLTHRPAGAGAATLAALERLHALMPTVVSFAVGLGPSRAVPSAPGRHSCITPRSPAQARPFGRGLRALRAVGSCQRGRR